jgi:hypothetical protein
MHDFASVRNVNIRNNIMHHPNTWIAISILVFAFIVRSPSFGNPFFHVDEVFYLLVGDEMLRGSLPYVDIWDRKPIGLFLIYASIRLLGGEGILQYQIVATIFAGCTAILISSMVSRNAGSLSKFGAGAAYLTWVNLFIGGGGQSPIFYNFFMALAAWLILQCIRADNPEKQFRYSAAAIFLAGCAIQIKYTALFEGIYFGLFILFVTWNLNRNLKKLIINCIVFASIGLFPTIIALLYYILNGHGEVFIQANFLSLFQRLPKYENEIRWIILAQSYLAPLTISAILGIFVGIKRDVNRYGTIFVIGWCISAIIGALIIGNFYFHYWLPVILPLSVAAGEAFYERWRIAILSFVILMPLFYTGWPGTEGHRRITAEENHLAALVRPHVSSTKCLYVYDGSPWLYAMTDSCLPTPYVFPEHLNYAIEETAIGVRASKEMVRVLSTKPGAIVTAEQPIVGQPNLATRKLLISALKQNYCLLARVSAEHRKMLVYVRLPASKYKPVISSSRDSLHFPRDRSCKSKLWSNGKT